MLSANEVRKMIPASQMFTVVFIKENGEQREMTCRRGVKKHLAGGTSTIAHKKNLISVFEPKKNSYRCFDINKVVCIKSKGKVLATKEYLDALTS